MMHANLRRLELAAALFLLAGAGPVLGQRTNVAPLGVASQTTTGFGGDAARGIDGNTSGLWGDNSITHTDTGDPAPAWRVDLPREFSLVAVQLWNRTDCCPERLSNFSITVFDELGTETYSDSFHTDGITHPFPSEEFALPAGTSGQAVAVALLGPNAGDRYLSLAEVEVFTDETDLAPLVLSQPRGGRVEVGSDFELVVEATGSGVLTYEWRLDDAPVPGATSPTLALASVGPEDAGIYTVVVRNSFGSETSDPAELIVTGKNLARRGEAYQSTTDLGAPAERAIDGNTDGVFGAGSVTHSAGGDPAPWWEVLLAGDSDLDSIVIWNRTDVCCPQRLTHFRLSVLDRGRREVFSVVLFDDLTFPDTLVTGFEVPLPPNTTGRFVRIERLGPDSGGELVLSLAEVEVFGEGPDPEPGSRHVARQSSEYAGGAFPARLALDGNPGTFSHTDVTDQAPAWELDLGAAFLLESLVIRNRADCCGSRLRDITVSIIDATGGGGGAGGDVVFESELLNPENILGAYPDGPPVLELDLQALTGDRVRGSLVRVARTPDPDGSGSGGQGNEGEPSVLSLGEFEFSGDRADCPQPGSPEFGDTVCTSVTVSGPPGGGAGVYTATAAATDATGDVVRFTLYATNGIVPSQMSGPSPVNVASFMLTPGTWRIGAIVDDDPFCSDAGPPIACETTVVVAGEINLAQGRPATQSSTSDPYGPELAVDGRLDTFSHTLVGANPPATWQVDLGATTAIRSIVLHNRADCCGSRLRDIVVSILDESGLEVEFESVPLNPENESGIFPDGPTTLAVEFDPPGIAGRFVRVVRLPDPDLSGTDGQGNPDEVDVLSLAEVEVFGEAGPTRQPFHRGDTDGSGGINLTDGVRTLNFLFLGGPDTDCKETQDFNNDGTVNITDGVSLFNFLFLGGPPPASPGPTTQPCGPDPDAPGSEDDLGCDSYDGC